MRPGVAVLLLALAASPAGAQEGHLRYLPSDTRLVFTIHYPALTANEQTQLTELMNRLYRVHLAPELGKDTRLPITDVQRVVIALPYAGSLNGIFLLTGKIDRRRLEQQMQQVARATNALSVERLGRNPLSVWTRQLDQKDLIDLIPPLERVPAQFRKLVAPQEAHVAALDDETLFVSLAGKKQLERAVRARGSDRLRVSDELGTVLRRQNPRDFTAGVVVEDSLHPGLSLVADEATRETFQKFDHITVRINGGSDVVFTIVIQGKSADVAPALEERSQRALARLRELLPVLVAEKDRRAIVETLLKSFRVIRKDAIVTLVGRLSEEDARKLMAPVKR